jgi:uncharacterized SAM-binding protein YcdF (DUF218 family)
VSSTFGTHPVKQESAETGTFHRTRTRRARRLAMIFLVVFAGIFGTGFLVFAERVTRQAAPISLKADAIVVLTGGHKRIQEAARLLSDGFGRRLLVSGVNRQATDDEVRKLTTLNQRLFDCCVDLGYEAKDTIGNAHETEAWVTSHRFTSVIVVTSDFHMPRSLAELKRLMPDVQLVPYPVSSSSTRTGPWWMSPGLLKVLVAEYIKFLPSAARLGLAQFLRAFETKTASTATPQPGRT